MVSTMDLPEGHITKRMEGEMSVMIDLPEKEMEVISGGTSLYDFGYLLGKVFRGIWDEYTRTIDWTRQAPV
jgi:hypothetical protein